MRPVPRAEEAAGGIALDSRAAALAGGDSGPAVVPGKPDESLLIEAVRRQGDVKMPPDKPLTDPQIAALTRWVELGAPWPASAAKPAETRPAAGRPLGVPARDDPEAPGRPGQ